MDRSVKIVARKKPTRADEVLTEKALDLVGFLTRNFKDIIEHLLAQRNYRQQEINSGKNPDFPKETAHIRAGSWKAGPIPADIFDRGVEITGPASSRKGVINAHNSGAKVFMADSEDAEAPTLENILNGQLNLHDAIRRTITFDSGDKLYELNPETAVLMYRPRGLHLLEKHVLVDGEPVPAMIFDLAMFLSHNAHEH